jgi:excisionase family DNA binding protein
MASESVSQWMTKQEATALGCISRSTLERLAREGRIGVLKLPGVSKTMFNRADVEALVAAGTRVATRREFAAV